VSYTDEDLEKFPRLCALGVPVHRERKGPPGVDLSELAPKLPAADLRRFERWAVGVTTSVNGIYPSDVEDFLAGRVTQG
jgi:hypothetical protein